MDKIAEICLTKDFEIFGNELLMDAYYRDMLDKFSYSKKRCFALTDGSENNFNNIDKDKVLNILTIYESNSPEKPNYISYFMTNNKYRNNKEGHAEYFNIGTGMVNALKSVFPNKSIDNYSNIESINFWKKNGFKNVTEQHMRYEV